MVWVPIGLTQEGLIVSIVFTEILACSRSATKSQAYLSVTFQLSQTAVVNGEMSSKFPTVPIKLNDSQP